jgi:hypothetical protein
MKDEIETKTTSQPLRLMSYTVAREIRELTQEELELVGGASGNCTEVENNQCTERDA